MSYQRAYELIFTDKFGLTTIFDQDADKPGLAIEFNIQKNITRQPNQSTIRIYNPARDTIASLQKEGVVTLRAGYDGDIATIFVGSKEQMNYIDDGATKSIELVCLEGTASHKDLTFAKNYFPGVTNAFIVQDLLIHLIASVPSINQQNLFSILSFTTYTQKQVVYGNAFDLLEQFLAKDEYQYFVNNGVITIIPTSGFIKDQAADIHVGSGMIGSPKPISETNADKTVRSGVEIETILNYNLDIGRLVRVNSDDFFNSFFRIESVNIRGNSFDGEWISNIKAFETNGAAL